MQELHFALHIFIVATGNLPLFLYIAVMKLIFQYSVTHCATTYSRLVCHSNNLIRGGNMSSVISRDDVHSFLYFLIPDFSYLKIGNFSYEQIFRIFFLIYFLKRLRILWVKVLLFFLKTGKINRLV